MLSRFSCCFICTTLVLAWFRVLPTASASTNHHVILITIDGLAAYYLSDPQAAIPTIRKLATEGAVAEAMRVSNPSVTWPNHTTLVTGVAPARHGVLFNGVLVRAGTGKAVRVDPARDKSDLVKVPTLYDQLRRDGYRTAGINWPCTRGSTALDDDFPDAPDPLTHLTPRLRDELMAARILAGTNESTFRELSAAARDQIWTASAAHVIRTHRPNFMLIHLLVTDSTQHKYGPQSSAAYTAVALADAQLAEVLRAVDAAGIREQTTVIVTADHGFAAALKIVNPNVAFRKAGLLETGAAPGILAARAQIISEGGTAMVYLTDPSTKDADRAKVLALLREQEGIAAILTPDQFEGLGLPNPSLDPQMAELILVAKDGYAFNNEARGEETITDVTLAAGNQGHHGYLSRNPKMNALFIAWGRGVKPGARLGIIDNIDVAPTIAKLLGEKLSDSDGKVLVPMLAGETGL